MKILAIHRLRKARCQSDRSGVDVVFHNSADLLRRFHEPLVIGPSARDRRGPAAPRGGRGWQVSV